MSKPEYVKRTIIKEKINSTALNEERSFRVYLPPGYNDLLSYPVLYAQDGQDIFMFGRIATIATELILDHGLEPVIIVGIDVQKKHRTSEYAVNGEKHSAYISFVTDELIPYVESHYPVKTEKEHRLLVGDSLGGTVSLDLAMDYPELFSKVISLSGAYFEPTYDKIQEKGSLDHLMLWMLVGTDETEVETHLGTFDFLEWNRKTKELLLEKGAQIEYLEKKGEHIWGFWQKELPVALQYFLKEKDW
ncbi:alpha/beta hydrolase [Bacillus horti]|uniref:Enterochelin esterase-like enzyme n=1 Tax=Caldalkalibacillus horti TaxID=77523 RepID=A0ABT9W5F8_9BACI|nr:alpha/beta hydrolase-fold protein [Bacillus horti]MDQ0168075.1 enterochelin esterase-like enzyme [Bacillus horti]